jgi:hypothetical protein
VIRCGMVRDMTDLKGTERYTRNSKHEKETKGPLCCSLIASACNGRGVASASQFTESQGPSCQEIGCLKCIDGIDRTKATHLKLLILLGSLTCPKVLNQVCAALLQKRRIEEASLDEAACRVRMPRCTRHRISARHVRAA